MKRLDETKWPRPSTRPPRDRDVGHFGRDETETRRWYVSRPSRDRDVETETTSLIIYDEISANRAGIWTVMHRTTVRHSKSHVCTAMTIPLSYIISCYTYNRSGSGARHERVMLTSVTKHHFLSLIGYSCWHCLLLKEQTGKRAGWIGRKITLVYGRFDRHNKLTAEISASEIAMGSVVTWPWLFQTRHFRRFVSSASKYILQYDRLS